jgi:hypothetical protein
MAGHGAASAFDRQRFANPSAWLDTNEKGNERSRSHFFGDFPKKPMWGYTTSPSFSKEELERRPATYTVKETSFASGAPVDRHVPAEAPSGQQGYADVLRSDPHHYPNITGTKEADFYPQPQRSFSMPGVIQHVEHWAGPPLLQPLERGRQSLNVDLSIFGDRFHEPPPPPPPPRGTFDWAQSPKQRRVRTSEPAADLAPMGATFGGVAASRRAMSRPSQRIYIAPETVSSLHKPVTGRYGATFHHPPGSVDDHCGKRGWFGTWTPTAPGLAGLYCPNKKDTSVW